MSAKTIFKRIIDHDLPADIVFEDDEILAFRDVSPQAPVHLLIIPKREIPSLAEAADSDGALLGRLLLTARNLAREFGLDQGFRTVINSGPDAGQSVPHLHLHLMGQRTMTWPPG